MREWESYKKYEEILKAFITNQDEKSLYEAEQLSRVFLEKETFPEEIINLHFRVLNHMYPDLSEEMKRSFEFLIEMMMGYGLAYREHLSLKDQQIELQSEIAVATNVQKTLLKTCKPNLAELEVGAHSVPAKQMNGDYYHFVQDEENSVSVAVADVIGKGIPAALCMSMIKYSMDSLPESRKYPSKVLETLNRVVGRNIDESMFITMFYGLYDTRIHRFFYASAGHEPGFYYHAKTDSFRELRAKGLLLGVTESPEYQEYQVDVDPGDMIILLTDGVTECRTSDDFIERETVVELIRENIHLPPQQIAENVYHKLEELQDFELRDDFTLVILKRKV